MVSESVMPIMVMVASLVTLLLRHRVAKFFAWFHREAPGGGGERVARKSTPRSILTTSILSFAFGAYLLLEVLGVVQDGWLWSW